VRDVLNALDPKHARPPKCVGEPSGAPNVPRPAAPNVPEDGL
jgi:hypothetical protein